MPRYIVEKRGGSGKAGTGIASKIRQTRSTQASAAHPVARNDRASRASRYSVGSHIRRNQQGLPIVGRPDRYVRADSSEDGIPPGKLSEAPSGSRKSPDRFQDRNARP